MYKIYEGDYVKTKEGFVGYVCSIGIMDGLFNVKYTNGEIETLKIADARKLFSQIGMYKFDGIEKLDKSLNVYGGLKNVKIGGLNVKIGELPLPQYKIINKINEIIDRLNEMED